MADLMARALGKAALRKVSPERTEKPFHNPRYAILGGKVLYSQELLEQSVDVMNRLKAEIEQKAQVHLEEKEGWLYDELASIINLYCAHLAVTGEGLRERLTELVRSDNRLSRLRLKYGWHDATKILPSHSRHVLIWTNRGEFRAYYDHVHDCWRTTRDGLKITHWREQCGPGDWPAAE